MTVFGKKVLLFLFFFITFRSNAFAQIFYPLKDWRYIPYREEFWSEFNNKIDTNETEDALKIAANNIGSITAAQDELEALMAVSIACEKLGEFGCSYFASIETLRLSPTSNQAALALVQIQTLAEKNFIEDKRIQKIINSGQFAQVPESVFSMVNYFGYMDNLEKGNKDWALQNASKVDPASFWGLKVKYLEILKLIEGNQLERAVELLTLLFSSSDKYPSLQANIQLQKARLLFELKRYQEADQIYSSFDFKGRNKGRSLFERAWTKYYQKDYSTALGLLESLKSPFFQSSIQPEQYILGMISYRDLCHYPSVKMLSEEFKEVFSESISLIKKGIPNRKNYILMRMTLQEGDLQAEADIVSYLTKVREGLNLILKKHSDSLETLIGRMKKYEDEIRGALEFRIDSRLEKSAETLLEFEEQVRLVDYVSELDEFRLRKVFENRSYKSEEIETIAIDTLYWPVRKEFWWEEMSNYQTRINDRCRDNSK